MWRHFGLILLLWMGLSVNGQETMNPFIFDLVATFQLTSPTILHEYDDGIPEICYSSNWVLCLSSNQNEGDLKGLPDYRESYKDSGNAGMHNVIMLVQKITT